MLPTALSVSSSVVQPMMASMFSAGAALLIAASAAPHSATVGDEVRVHQIRVAAIDAAREDARVYLETESRRDAMIFASVEPTQLRHSARYDTFTPKR